MMHIDIEAFQASLNQRIDTIKQNVFDEVVKAGNEIRNEAVMRTPVKTGNLRASWQTRNKKIGTGGEVIVYNNAKYWQAVEYGTKPHVITVKKKQVLANKKTGQVFGKRVNHPGTKPKPMVRPALKTVIPKLIERLKRI
jgi:HK97 gp10 family phage protein